MDDASNLTSPPQNLSSSPFCVSSASSELFHSSVTSLPNKALHKLSSDLENLISESPDDCFSDAILYISGRAVPVHRCVLSARSSFFKDLFSKKASYLSSFAPPDCKEEESSDHATIVKIDIQRLFDSGPKLCRVGFDAFMSMLKFMYTGRQTVPAIRCLDDQCPHEACWPAVEFAIEMLSVASVLDIGEQKAFWQCHLHNMIDKAQVDEVLLIAIAAEVHGDTALQSLSKHTIAVSSMDTIDLEKQLPSLLAQEILSLRSSLGLLQADTLNPTHQKECQRIRKALDSADVELVELLLKEGRVNLDGAHALHYATMYCNPCTVQDILELGLADPNLRNNRGFTVLHIASMRREPAILVGLLSKGANPLDLTPDGRTSLQICSRLIKSCQYLDNNDVGEAVQKDRLSMEILDQAGRKHSFVEAPFNPVVDEKELILRLLYLENRVAVARLLFPQQVKLVTGISHLEAIPEFVGLGGYDTAKRARMVDASVDLNQSTALTSPVISEVLVKRVQALQKTVELGKRIFPRCTAIINSFMDDDLSELSCIETGSPEEQKIKKRRYIELKEVLAEAFRKDVAAMDKLKAEKSDSQKSSPAL